MRIINNILKIFTVSLLLFSCSGALDGFKFKRKSTSGDEFLIQKKDPLILPPDFSKLPKPKERPETIDEDINIKSVFDGDQSRSEGNNDQNPSNSNIKKIISDKIKKQ